MHWQAPELTVVRMDAEIGSYQEDDPAREQELLVARGDAPGNADDASE